MRIPRVHADAELGIGVETRLDESRSHYLKNVLRLKAGAELILFDGRQAIDYHATLAYDGKRAVATIDSARPVQTESPLHSHLVLGLARADHTDWALQKTTELGVSRISLFNAARTQSPLKPAQSQKKLTHWRGVITSAAEQCGRARLPGIGFYSGLESALEAIDESDRLLLDFTGAPLASERGGDLSSVAILLGPEGGLDAAEIRAATAVGCRPVSLGPRVLRTETAATVALALVQRIDSGV